MSLYRHDRISSGMAARLLGVHRLTFIRMLAEEGVPYLDYTNEELRREVGAVERGGEVLSQVGEWPQEADK